MRRTIAAMGLMFSASSMQHDASLISDGRAPPTSTPQSLSCDALIEQFDATLKASSGACNSAAACACYPDLRIDGKLGVADLATAAKLKSLSNQYRKKECPTIFVSTAGPPKCAPVCNANRCE